MPIKDTLLTFNDAQSLAGNAGDTIVFTDVVQNPVITDHKGNSGYNSPGIDQAMCWNCVVDTTALLAAVDGCVLTFNLYADTDSTPTTGGDIILSRAITVNTPAEAAHADGKVLFSIPLPIETIKPYLGVSVAIATQNLSAGAVTSWIGPAIVNV